MSNTFKTNKARQVHKARVEGHYNAGQANPSELILQSEGDKIKKLQLEARMSGERHGCNRQHHVNIKINERRVERFAKRDELRKELKAI